MPTLMNIIQLLRIADFDFIALKNISIREIMKSEGCPDVESLQVERLECWKLGTRAAGDRTERSCLKVTWTSNLLRRSNSEAFKYLKVRTG